MDQVFANYAGVILGIIGILVSVVLAVRYAEKKDPRLFSISDQKISLPPDGPHDVAIFFRGEAVERVTSTLIWFWNAGKKPILREDLPRSQPLLLHVGADDPSLTILDVGTKHVSRPSIDFSAKAVSANTVAISFAFLDAGDGGVIEVQHTGAQDVKVKASGVILGVPKGVRASSANTGSSEMVILAGRSRHRQSMPRLHSAGLRVLASLVIICALGGLAVFMFYSAADLTTDKSRIISALNGVVSPNLLDQVVSRIEKTSKFRNFNRTGSYLMSAFLFLNMIVGLFIVWMPRQPYPIALQLKNQDDGPGDSALDAAT